MPMFGLQPADLLQTIFEEIGVALAVLDRNGKLAFANRTAMDLFGIDHMDSKTSFQEWRRKYTLENSLGHEISLEESAVMRALRGERVESQETKAKFPDGTTKWLLTWAYPFSAMGLGGVLALVVDETTEVELRRAASQLQRMETLGALAAGLTHDLNNILDTISLNVELAATAKCETQDFRARLSRISIASTKAAGLVKRLMQFSRTQALDYQPVQLNEIVADVLHLVAPLLRQNIVLETSLQSGLPLIRGDTLQLEQALVNLIVNALDAMPTGGTLKISTNVERKSAVPAKGNKDIVSITVADTGPGIPEEHQSAVFEPFFTTKPAGKGTGLGLSSTYGIVKQHQGNIAVHNVPGAGATFVISLPVLISTAVVDKAS
jgi:two-component system cell cycle sensor histidine kinase/response regulator CckA